MVSYKTVFEGLSKHNINYLVAGGFAVNFHQVQRATVDLDLIIQIEKENILKFVKMMEDLGFAPRVPVRAVDLANETIRKKWILEKGMMVFTFINASNPFEVIDVFCEEPFPFSEMWDQRFQVSAFGLSISVVSKKHLIEMKQIANREKDRFDIEQLKKIKS